MIHEDWLATNLDQITCYQLLCSTCALYLQIQGGLQWRLSIDLEVQQAAIAIENRDAYFAKRQMVYLNGNFRKGRCQENFLATKEDVS